MKRIYYLFSLIAAVTLLSGCEKELMDYQGGESLYFDVRRGAEWIDPSRWGHQYFTAIEFGNIGGDEVSIDFKIMATGKTKDYDRSFTVKANPDSTTAVAGTNYTINSETFTIKAGETSCVVPVTFFRTENIDNDTLQLQLQIYPSDEFTLNYKEFADNSTYYSPEENKLFANNKDASIHNIFIFDVLSRPKAWAGNDVTGQGLFGKYSQKKYRLMMEITQTTVNDYISMPSARQQAISEKMSLYLLEKAKMKDPVLDEDGTMMFFMKVTTLGGSAAWAPFTKPEDYYK